MIRSYTGFLYLNLKTGAMRILKTNHAPHGREIRIQVNVSVDIPEEAKHLLEVRATVPPRVVEQLTAEQLEAEAANEPVEE